MRIWPLWLALLACWLLTACALYVSAQAAYVIFRMVNILAVAGG